jgi:phosphate transport system substrate-binding protein
MKLKQFFVGMGGVALVSIPVLSYAGTTLNGAGATFPAVFYARVFNDYSNTSGNKVNYQSLGSGAGIRQFIAGTVDFAASDEPISSKDASKVKRGVVQIPMVGGTIAIAYNKPGCNLNLTQKQTVDVFLGKINDWKQLKCAPGKITTAHRSDGSGTTFAFTNSLKAFSSSWTPGVGKSVKWPVGVGGKGNEGVSGIIKNTPGSLGYVSYSFVKSQNLQVAAIQNKSGKFVSPGAKSGSAALNQITLDTNLAGENPNPSGVNSYPISTLTWVLAYKNGNGAKTDEIRGVLNYSLGSTAQMIADDLGYVPLSGSVLNKARLAVNRISK